MHFTCLCRAATEAGSDHESPEPTKDVVTLLAPFLPPQPQTSGSQPAPREFSVDAIVPSSPDVLSPEAERAEVQAFVDQQQVNSGLYAVASALLGKLLSSPAMPISPKLREDLMRLENAVQGKHRLRFGASSKLLPPEAATMWSLAVLSHALLLAAVLSGNSINSFTTCRFVLNV